MDFFHEQDRAKQKTSVLVILFFIAISLIVSTTLLAFLVVIPEFFRLESLAVPLTGQWFEEVLANADRKKLMGIALSIVVVILGASYFRILMLARGGGAAIAEMLDGRKVQASSDDLNEKILYNVVEEMAIASGTPVPEVYVLEETGINAFAAGNDVHSAVIGVTRGALEKLDRNELQGVIAHEFSHIAHGDMRINLRLIGVLFGILFLREIGYHLLRGTSNSKKGNQVAFLGLVLMVLGVFGYFFGSWIKAAISRQREFLADATAVQYTRYPAGISSALKKIGSHGSLVRNSRASEASHLFFAKGVSGFFSRMFATHPPLRERIRRLEGLPNFASESVSVSESGLEEAGGVALPLGFSQRPIESGQAKSRILSVAQIQPSSLAESRMLTDSMPSSIKDAAHDPFGAVALIYSILLNGGQGHSSNQLDYLERNESRGISEETKRLMNKVRDLSVDLRIPLLEMCAPSLKQLSISQKCGFLKHLRAFIQQGTKPELFEYVFVETVAAMLEGSDLLKSKRRRRNITMDNAKAVLLSALSDEGHHDKSEAQKAYQAGMAELGLKGRFQERVDWDVARFDDAIGKLDLLSFKQKRTFLLACVTTASHDGRIETTEYEILRGLAGALRCPIPHYS